MPGQPNDPKDADLLALRDRLRQARAERGTCPPWEELKADLVPGGAGRPGREERQAHAAICPYCGEHVREWRKSFDYEADRLAAIEKGVATGIMRGAKGLGRAVGRTLSGRGARKAAEVAPAQAHEPAHEHEHEEGVAPALPVVPQRMYTPPAETSETHGKASRRRFRSCPGACTPRPPKRTSRVHSAAAARGRVGAARVLVVGWPTGARRRNRSTCARRCRC
jgi:hypothetical protein